MKNFTKRVLLILVLAAANLAALAALPVPGKAYKITTRSTNFYITENKSNLTTTATKPTDKSYVWVCVPRPGGKFAFVNYVTGKYLGWRGLQTTAFDYTIAESSTYSGYCTMWSDTENRYVWTSTTAGSNTSAFNYGTVVSQDAGWISEFLFEEETTGLVAGTINKYLVNDKIKAGSIYALRCSSGHYLFDNNGTVATSATLPDDEAYYWTVDAYDEANKKYIVRNVKYNTHKLNASGAKLIIYSAATSNEPILDGVQYVSRGAFSIICGGKFMTYDGSGVAQTGATTIGDGTTRFTDFFFDKIENFKLSVKTVADLSLTFGWNGELLTGNSVNFLNTPGATVSDNNITTSFVGNSTYAPGSFSAATWDGNSNLSVFYAPTANIFCDNYGEKWVRVKPAAAAGTNNSWTLLPADAYAGATPRLAALNFADEGQLWCFVGTPENFKVYNKRAGNALMLGYAATSSGTALTMTDVAANAEWKLSSDYLTPSASVAGFAIVPASATTMAARCATTVGSALTLYDVADNASHVVFEDATARVDISPNVSTSGGTTPSALHSKLSEVTVACGAGSQCVDLLLSGNTFYVPQGETFTLTNQNNHLGYELGSFSSNGFATVATQTVTANYTETNADVRFLFSEDEVHDGTFSVPYRIPAIVKAQNGDLLVFSDERYSGNDIGRIVSGANTYRVDIVARVSHDGGNTWEPKQTVLEGTGVKSELLCGFGDAAVAANSESNDVLLMSVVGAKTDYPGSTRSNPIRVYRTRLALEGGNWVVKSESEVTDYFYGFNAHAGAGVLHTDTKSVFFTSGRILQSQKVKVGAYYRLYAAVVTNRGVFVVFSDDFGETWACLGGNEAAVGNASPNESKVEELPNGNIVVSMRKSGGRQFNVFRFDNLEAASGSWDTPANSSVGSGAGSDCNGEIYFVDAYNSSNVKVRLALQSLPRGGSRRDVSIYYKALTTADYTSASTLAAGWSGPYTVYSGSSAYSVMAQLDNKELGFVLEEAGKNNSTFSYNIAFLPLSIETITGGDYRAEVPNNCHISMTTGTFTETNTEGTDARTWTSAQSGPQLLLKSYNRYFSSHENDMQTADGNLILYANGQKGYIVSISSGYVITGYEFDFTNNDTNDMSIWRDDTSEKLATAGPGLQATASETGLSASQVRFRVGPTVSGGDNQKVTTPGIRVTYRRADIDMTAGNGGDGKSYLSLCYPEDLEILTEGTAAYALTLNAERTEATPVVYKSVGDVIPAETPVVVINSNAESTLSFRPPLTQDPLAERPAENVLMGTLVDIVLDGSNNSSYLVLGKSGGKIGFYRPSASVTSIPQYRAYIDNSTFASNGFAISFGDPTAIENPFVSAKDHAQQGSAVFDLQGRRVERLGRGIYIRNGKKIIIK